MCGPLLSTNNLLLSVPFRGTGGSHPILPVERASWEIDSRYRANCVVRCDYLSIIPGLRYFPQTYRFARPVYSITFVAVQRQPQYHPRLGIDEKNEIWTEDGYGCLRRLIVGKCQGQIQGHFVFPCWGCEVICDSAYDHQTCPYGLLKVERDFLHPLFDTDAVPDFPLLGYEINDIWSGIPPDNHLRLALVYPPGYVPDVTTWYERYLPIAVFTVEKEEELIAQERERRGTAGPLSRQGWSRRLWRESAAERRGALLARDLSRRLAELCQAKWAERTYRRMLRSMGVTA